MSGVMKIFHWSGSPPSRRPSIDRRTQTLNPGPDNGGASLYAQNDSQQLLDEIVQQEGLE